MLTDTSWDAIYRWVDDRFDVAFREIPDNDFYLIEHGAHLADYHGVSIWRMGQKTLVSMPLGMLNAVSVPIAWRLTVDELPLTALTEPSLWRAALGERVERIIGPSYQGFVDADAFRPTQTQGARPLTASDRPALQRFIAACPPGAWRDSAIALDHDPIMGLERAGELVALASAPLDGPAELAMRSVGVVTLPAARGTGAGLAVVSALTERIITSYPSMLLHYQTLRANLPSVAIAQRLGFEDVATSLAVRLR